MRRVLILLLVFGIFALSGIFLATVSENEKPFDPFELRDLAISRKFEELDRRITEAWRRYEAGEIREGAANGHLRAFQTSDPALKEPLDEWVAAMPDSWAAPAARGHYRYRAGWLSRGDKLARETSDERFRRMREFFSLARQDFETALARKKRLPTVHSALIDIAKAEGQEALAADLLAAAMEADPWSFRIRTTYLSGLEPKWGGSEEAMRRFVEESLRWVEKNPDLEYLEIQYREYMARKLMHDGKTAEAVEAYDAILADKETGPLYMIRGQLHEWLGHQDQALADFDRAIELYPYWRPPLRARASIKRKLGKYEEVLADLDLAVRIDPLDPEYLHSRAWHLDYQARFDEAVRDLTDALVYGWDDVELWVYRADIYINGLRDHKSAIPDFKKAVELAPGEARYWWLYGNSLARLGKCEAIPVWKTYKRICDGDPKCDRRIYLRMQQMTEALINEKHCTPGSR